jgi:hypothetical protein
MLRKDLNHPPTAVGGIPTSNQIRARRNDLKYPPTAVEWYSDFLCKAHQYNRKTVISRAFFSIGTLYRQGMKNSRIIFMLLLTCCCAVTGVAQTQSKAEASEVVGKPLLIVARSITTEPPANAVNALRSGKLIYVKSSSLFVSSEVVEEKLLRRSEFQAMGLMVTRDAAAADIILELRHDVFTKYVYTATDPKTNVVIAGGKLSSLGGTVAGKLAERFLKQLVRARQSNTSGE